MKLVDKQAFQGDVLLRRVEALPTGVVEAKRNGPIIISHSETNHHHAVDDMHARMFEDPKDPLVCYLQLGEVGECGGVDLVHCRPFDTHETLRLLGKPGDVWEARRQREWAPEGWRRVQD